MNVKLIFPYILDLHVFVCTLHVHALKSVTSFSQT